MRRSSIFLSILIIFGICAFIPISAQTRASSQRIVIAASAVFDGKGHVLHDVRIVIEGSKICCHKSQRRRARRLRPAWPHGVTWLD
jgi:hypothetical protein